jgi:hypothetical protein
MAQPKRRDTAERVLAVESLTAKVLRQSVDQVAKRAGASGMSPAHAALVVQATATLAITKAHEAARAKAADVFEAQTGLSAAEDEGDERSRAQQAAGGLAKAFRENLTEHLAAGLGATAAYGAAMRDLRPNIERTATTEVMHAWNGETRRLARASRADVTQTWHAELDACDECAGLDGQTIQASDVFPYGDPPLHPRCRCYVESAPAPIAIEDERPAAVPTGKKALNDAVAKANERGAVNMNYMREGMRDLSQHRGAYAGATAAQVEAIATGRMAAMNSGKVLPPIKVILDSGDLVLQDGRHRMTAAIEAGAQNIHAEVHTYTKTGKKVSRMATISLRGTLQ